ncbi:MAG: glycoside hydrolase family 5 protein [Armatimonadetes bacterium]|nr:glycoside hydrolase family 5 protein [Armatimonadota bacterium]
MSVGAASADSGGPSPAATKPLPYTGVNLAGGEFFDPQKVPDPVYGKHFTYPTEADFDYFASKGMNVFRIPFRWETLQPRVGEPFRKAEIDRLKAVVTGATRRGLVVILDLHNYARHSGKIIGSPEVSHEDFANFWVRLAREFRSDRRVWFGLMNEPHGISAEQWVPAANAAIAAIRKAGATNLLLVPGTAWTGAHSWLDDWYGGANGVWMLNVKDPLNRYAYDVHQYLDKDSSGTRPEVVSPTIGSERLRKFVEWSRKHKKRAFLGEFAVPATEEGRAALHDMLHSMERDRDVWLGFTWWAAGAWWGDYMFSIQPKDGKDRPQMEWLRPHLQGRSAGKRVPRKPVSEASQGPRRKD